MGETRWVGPTGIFLLSLLLLYLTQSASYFFIRGAASFLVLVVPGYALWREILSEEDTLLSTILSFGGGLVTAIFLLYGAVLIPGPVEPELLILSQAGILLAAILISSKKGASYPAAASLPRYLILFLLLIAGIVRFPSLGGAEFQGDEARALHIAVVAIQGDDEVMYRHKKGPVEELLPIGVYAIAGEITESTARLPFTVCGIFIVLAVSLLASKLSVKNPILAASAAGVAASLDGIEIAFSRIVQYQMPLLFLSLVSWLALDSYRSKGRSSYAVLAALSYAGALWCHYDAILLLPALGYLLIDPIRKDPRRAAILFGIGLLGAAIVIAFYLPFVRHEHFAQTQRYLSERLGSASAPYLNLARYTLLLMFYSTTFQVVAAIVLLIAAAWSSVRRLNSPMKYGAAVLFIIALGTALVLKTTTSSVEVRTFVLISFTIFLLLSLWSVRGSTRLASALLLFAVPLIAFTFFSYRPNTHFYVAHPGAVVIAAAMLASIMSRSKLSFSLGAIFSAALFLVSLPYIYIAYLRQHPEYRLVFPKARSAIYKAPYGDELPSGAYFGFAHNSGWRAVATVVGQIESPVRYGSNEEELITSWYLPGAIRDDEHPDIFLLSSRPNDPVAVNRGAIEKEFSFIGRVYVAGQRALDIYSKYGSTTQPTRYDLEPLEDSFHALSRHFRMNVPVTVNF